MNIDNITTKNSSFNKHFLKFCNIAITLIMTILTGYLFLLNIFNTCMINSYAGYEKTAYLSDSPLFHIAAIVLVFLLGYLINSHLRIPSEQMLRRVLIIIHIIMAIVMLYAIFTYNYYPVYDQLNTTKAVYELINSDYSSWEYAGYNYIYPAQNSLVLFLIPPIYLFGMQGGIIAFRVFNLIMFFFASYSVYEFCKEIKINSVMTSVLYICYSPLALYTFFIYGNMASLSLSLFAIWMAVKYLNSRKIKNAILCIISLNVGLLFKETAAITMIAILIVFFIHGITSRQWGKLLWIPAFIAMYLVCSLTVNTIIESITGTEIPQNLGSYGHLTMGLSEGDRANGWYNDFTMNTFAACNYDPILYKAVTKEALLKRIEILLNNPSYAASFFSKKTASQWSNPTFESTWILQDMLLNNVLNNMDCIPCFLFIDGSVSNMIYYYFFNLMQSMILFGSFCFFTLESRNMSLSCLLPAIVFIGGFIFLFFYEAKAQYSLLFFIMLFPYTATGFTSMFNGLMQLTSNNSPRKWYRSKEVIVLGILLGIILLISITNIKPINNNIKLGTDDLFYNECIEQNLIRYKLWFQIPN